MIGQQAGMQNTDQVADVGPHHARLPEIASAFGRTTKGVVKNAMLPEGRFSVSSKTVDSFLLRTADCLLCTGEEPLMGFEPTTCSLRMSCSTAELKRRYFKACKGTKKFIIPTAVPSNLFRQCVPAGVAGSLPFPKARYSCRTFAAIPTLRYIHPSFQRLRPG